jgi:hypothetical protein
MNVPLQQVEVKEANQIQSLLFVSVRSDLNQRASLSQIPEVRKYLLSSIRIQEPPHP